MYRSNTFDPWKENIQEFNRRSTFEEISHYLSDLSAGHPDPLSVYLPYLNDTKFKHSSPLLIQTLHHFAKSPVYSNDPRYLNLWVIYAENCQDPLLIYEEMLQKNIGLAFAMIYVAIAEIYEARRQYIQAEHAYLLGVFRQAEPLIKLKKLYNDFLHRTSGPRAFEKYSDEVSVEEAKALLSLRFQAHEIEDRHEFPLCQSPARVIGQSTMHLSACKKTPTIEGIYQSPHISNVIFNTSPYEIRGRRPFTQL
ncbi:unnamed protein product [Blepharisma stoltei]|uniref:BUB1 N-terminal domain-containing protein n=1 Tax=Blepharisma stoltei TaxID=1481888 RepID=A0AAU9JHB0_9CILI|nr:unnamed protein product [Blepharisma stoltei]